LHPLPLHFLSFSSSLTLRVLHSFPTRRSSDLLQRVTGCQPLFVRRDMDVRVQRLNLLFARDDFGTAHVRRMVKNLPVKIGQVHQDRKSTRLNSSHVKISYAVFCLKKKKKKKKR